MIDRKKKLRLIQFSLLIVSFFIIYFTYYAKEKSPDDEIISEVLKNKVKKSTNEDLSGNSDTFFDVEYTGLDLNGNRYL